MWVWALGLAMVFPINSAQASPAHWSIVCDPAPFQQLDPKRPNVIPARLSAEIDGYSDRGVRGQLVVTPVQGQPLTIAFAGSRVEQDFTRVFLGESKTAELRLDLMNIQRSFVLVAATQTRYVANCADLSVLAGLRKEVGAIRRSGANDFTLPDWNLEFNTSCLNQPAPIDRARVCTQGLGALLSERSSDPCMRTSFTNGRQMGILGDGLCWWHDRFHRQAWYLAEFDPSQPYPEPRELKRLLTELYFGKSLVVFPGFSNWAEVSLAARDLMLDLMTALQLKDGVTPATWPEWFLGKPSPEEVYRYGREIEENFKQGLTTFIFIKYAGSFGMHSKLIYDVRRTGSKLDFTMTDSNVAFPLQSKPWNRMSIVEASDGTGVFEGDMSAWRPAPSDANDRIVETWQQVCAHR